MSTAQRLHTCTACGASAPWGSSWSAFASMQEIEDGKDVPKACSIPCLEKLCADMDLPQPGDEEQHEEPLQAEIEPVAFAVRCPDCDALTAFDWREEDAHGQPEPPDCFIHCDECNAFLHAVRGSLCPLT